MTRRLGKGQEEEIEITKNTSSSTKTTGAKDRTTMSTYDPFKTTFNPFSRPERPARKISRRLRTEIRIGDERQTNRTNHMARLSLDSVVGQPFVRHFDR